MSYTAQLVAAFWLYRAERYADRGHFFDEDSRRGLRPPVFLSSYAVENILIDPALSPAEVHMVHSALPRPERHRWFRSMKSSQALVQSVFGNLCALARCDVLHAVKTEDGFRPFEGVGAHGAELQLERKILALREPRSTSIDIDVKSSPRVAIECKLSEHDVGTCSRPTLGDKKPDHCDGCYRQQRGRSHRCALTNLEIRYWEFIPELFAWDARKDHVPCPLRSTYQLVRNVLAASVTEDGQLEPGCTVLLYDMRNPAFRPGGAGHEAYAVTKAALREPRRLQRMTWQVVLDALRTDARLKWLTAELRLKYGL